MTVILLTFVIRKARVELKKAVDGNDSKVQTVPYSPNYHLYIKYKKAQF
jgi:hypothetical protein